MFKSSGRILFVTAAISFTCAGQVAVAAITPPPSFAGKNLVLDLSADALQGTPDNTPIATWADQSGAGNNGTASGTSQPLYKSGVGPNGKSVLRFDGVNDSMFIGSNFNVGSIFVLASYTAATFDTYDGLFTRTSGGGSPEIYFIGNSGASAWYPANDDGSILRYVNGVHPAGDNNTIPTLNQFNTYGAVDSTPANSPTSAWLIGNDRGDQNRSWNGDVAEVIVYDQPLTDAERGQVEAYITQIHPVPEPGTLLASIVPAFAILRRWRK